MAKKQEYPSSAGLALLLVYGVLVFGIVTLAKNITDLRTLYYYGFDVYLDNITDFEWAAGPVKLKQPMTAYPNPDISLLDNKDGVTATMPAGATVFVAGSLEQTDSSLAFVPMEFYEGRNRKQAYFFTEGDWGAKVEKGTPGSGEVDEYSPYFEDPEVEDLDDYKKVRLEAFRSHVLSDQELAIHYTTEKVRMEQVRASDDRVALDDISEDEKLYHMPAANIEKYEVLYERLVTDHLKTWRSRVAQFGPGIDSDSELSAGYSDPVFFWYWDRYWFVSRPLALALLVLIASRQVAYFKRPRCTQCGSRRRRIDDESVERVGYEFENQDGSPDKRRSKNRKIYRTTEHSICKKCSNEFDVTYLEYI